MVGTFAEAVRGWVAAGRGGIGGLAGEVEEAARRDGVRVVVLVEGVSDAAAVRELGVRLGRDLAGEGVCVLPIGGAMGVGRYVGALGGGELRLAGLCDAAEERWFARALERARYGTALTRPDLARLGFHVCVADLEDELIRALGAGAVQEIVEAEGELRKFRTFQKQPAQRTRTVEQQLHRFLGTHSGRKEQYGRSLVAALDLAHTPTPLHHLLAQL
ncbi:TOPRIM nucleotidyl transferase/hydrolase domain-containing protein [Actinacidiphila guanduensis]|uniref:OLD protein-like TOPRIM domain-containing protein n=1 Tax=Actinacidiphila guanduensis TaxID=310781 RepID=A0A1G9YGJ0_9ACTN|nr:TOPRIM nucleotidyl transferase/hydrolase domain-containing protein [Actinacidiphila guanduensis]SDN08052.1 hypothetical protein SAMN05216259_102548 [Actinacidiphila guanduensis]